MIRGLIGGAFSVEAYEQYGNHEGLSTVYTHGLDTTRIDVTMAPSEQVAWQLYDVHSKCMIVDLGEL